MYGTKSNIRSHRCWYSHPGIWFLIGVSTSNYLGKHWNQSEATMKRCDGIPHIFAVIGEAKVRAAYDISY